MDMTTTLLRNFFTHKDFLPPPDRWPGTLFSPLQIIFCAVVAVFLLFAAFRCAKKSEAYLQKVFFVLWLIMLLSEPGIILWEAYTGKSFSITWENDLPLWPCSIFLYAAPFAIFGRGNVRFAACGYICTLGLLGGMINFVYPATYLAHYSCISLAGFRTVFYHGALIFVALTMLLSGYHSYRGITERRKLFYAFIPTLLISLPANIANTILPDADYMFFKLRSFFFAPIGQALPTLVCVLIVYILYLIIHTAPYLPSYLANKQKTDR